ncbi:MAG TPA: hypothetical protein VI504_09980 [Candidatus Eisenbacteria bacterium]|jgi:hypothetical protein
MQTALEVVRSSSCGLAMLVLALFAPGVERAAATPAVQWRELRAPARSAQVMVWDSRRQHALMLGGDLRVGEPFGGV